MKNYKYQIGYYICLFEIHRFPIHQQLINFSMPGMISDLFNWFLIPIRRLLVNVNIYVTLLHFQGYCIMLVTVYFSQTSQLGRTVGCFYSLDTFKHLQYYMHRHLHLCILTYASVYITIIQEQLAMLKSCKRNFLYTKNLYIYKETEDAV